MTQRATFDTRFINELIAEANKMTLRQMEWMSSVGIRKELEGKYDDKTIDRMEDIYWTCAAGKRAAEQAGV